MKLDRPLASIIFVIQCSTCYIPVDKMLLLKYYTKLIFYTSFLILLLGIVPR